MGDVSGGAGGVDVCGKDEYAAMDVYSVARFVTLVECVCGSGCGCGGNDAGRGRGYAAGAGASEATGVCVAACANASVCCDARCGDVDASVASYDSSVVSDAGVGNSAE